MYQATYLVASFDFDELACNYFRMPHQVYIWALLKDARDTQFAAAAVIFT